MDMTTGRGQELEDSIGDTSELVDYVLVTVTIFTAVVVLFGNILTITAIVTIPEMNHQANFYILSLAVADSIVGVAMLVMSFRYMRFSKKAFDEHKYLCLSGYILATISSWQSLLTLAVMAFDRLLCVERPFLYVRLFTDRLIKTVLACSWVISVTYGTLPSYFNTFDPAVGCVSFRVFPNNINRFFFATPAFTFIFITSACYVRIACIAQKHRKRIAAEMSLSLGQEPAKAVNQNTTNQQKSTGLFLTMNTIFIACWTPFLINCLLSGLLDFTITEKAAAPAMFLAMSNSGMNFFIYALKNKQFARAYRRLLRHCSCRAEWPWRARSS